MYLALFLPVQSSIFYLAMLGLIFAIYHRSTSGLAVCIAKSPSCLRALLILLCMVPLAPYLLLKIILLLLFCLLLGRSNVINEASQRDLKIFLGLLGVIVGLEYYFLNTFQSPIIAWPGEPFSSRLTWVFGEPTWMSLIFASIAWYSIISKPLCKKRIIIYFLVVLLLLFNKSRAGLGLAILALPVAYFIVRGSDLKRWFQFAFLLVGIGFLFPILIGATGREVFDVSTASRIEPVVKVLQQSPVQVLFGNVQNYNMNNYAGHGLYERSLGSLVELLYRIGLAGTCVLVSCVVVCWRSLGLKFSRLIYLTGPLVFFGIFHPALETHLAFLVLWIGNAFYYSSTS